MGCAGGSGSGRLHAQIAGQTGEETACEKGNGYPGVLHVEDIGHDGKEKGEADENQSHDLVLLAQVGHGTLAYGGGDVLHPFGAFGLGFHVAVEVPRKEQGHHGRYGNEPKKLCFHIKIRLIGKKDETSMPKAGTAWRN